MTDVRPLNRKKYGISKYAFIMTRAYCLQYNEWKEKIRNTSNTVRSVETDKDSVSTSPPTDPTANLGNKHMELYTKMELVEDTVMEAVGKNTAMYPYLLKYVTTEDATCFKMQQDGMPYGSTLFYETRRKFYYLLSKKLEKALTYG